MLHLNKLRSHWSERTKIDPCFYPNINLDHFIFQFYSTNGPEEKSTCHRPLNLIVKFLRNYIIHVYMPVSYSLIGFFLPIFNNH